MLLQPQTHGGTLRVGRGMVRGTVRDTAGGVIPGVTVELHCFPGTFHGSAMVTEAVRRSRSRMLPLSAKTVVAGVLILVSGKGGYRYAVIPLK